VVDNCGAVDGTTEVPASSLADVPVGAAVAWAALAPLLEAAGSGVWVDVGTAVLLLSRETSGAGDIRIATTTNATPMTKTRRTIVLMVRDNHWRALARRRVGGAVDLLGMSRRSSGRGRPVVTNTRRARTLPDNHRLATGSP
jgi:hypothetical protein